MIPSSERETEASLVLWYELKYHVKQPCPVCYYQWGKNRKSLLCPAGREMYDHYKRSLEPPMEKLTKQGVRDLNDRNRPRPYEAPTLTVHVCKQWRLVESEEVEGSEIRCVVCRKPLIR